MHPSSSVLRGILALVLGLVLVFRSGATLDVLLIFFPLFAVFDGIGAIVIGLNTAKEGRWLSFIPTGILEIILGIIVFVWPAITIATFVLLMTLWAFVLGLSELFIALTDKKLTAAIRWLSAISGILTVAFGVLVSVYPLATSLIVIWMTGVFFLVYGLLLSMVGVWVSAYHKKAARG